MNIIKKGLWFALLMLLVICMLFGCNTDLPEETTGTTNGTNVTEKNIEESTVKGVKSLRINGTPVQDFTVVYTKKASSGSEKALEYLNEKVNELYGVTLAKSSAVKDRYEILVGFDGGNTEISSAYQKNSDGFIGVSNKKIYILGLNYSALCGVIDTFFSKAQGNNGDEEIMQIQNENLNLKKESIKVMSYNVYWDTTDTKRNLNNLIDTIRSENPDVFGTQECTVNHKTAILGQLSQYDCYAGYELKTSTKQGNYIFWNKDKYKVIVSDCLYMSDTPNVKSKFPESEENRAFSYVSLENKETGYRFMFICLHTDYKGISSDVADIARQKQLATVNKFMEKYPDLPIIIVGDFNATSTSDSIISFQDNPRLAMTSYAAKQKGDTGGTLVGGYYTRRDMQYVFDYIFVTCDRIATKYYSVIDNAFDGKYPSDHLPVVAKLDLF